jgi:hypothetical protein
MQDQVAHLAALGPMPGGVAAVAGPGGRGATA